ncbi:MAG: hypothetical protein Q8M93_15275 [Polaromonas sp.]|uniref:hypothetical protein n=1 Tax=Polaromonas sp. TaxID=1869339 RepID=UPI002728434D|nr:hypothetical protein [Polaromonas sp.]MDO9112820.1 hypothetical protein [Polaromonas sp.]MDP1886786.1 hypothetical protein [Polaromonas sp.]MDP3248310.1 hypothetical protein [Polaromonas sp.]
MKTNRMGLALLACTALLQVTLARAQLPPKFPAGTEVPPAGPQPKGWNWQAPREPKVLSSKDYLAQVPGHAGPGADTAASRQADAALLTAQTTAIKALSKRLEALEARVQQMEVTQKAGGTR